MINSPTKKESPAIERPPVVAVMGHIDHGKSKLLDYIRHTNVVENESGGITQHTSAYEVSHQERKITFLDTPGHAAFTAMRDRGARIADLAILVVSAEEGVKPQTLEALESIKTQKIPFVVAINKIDKPEADPTKTRQGLAENGVFVEGYGGNVPCAEISALTGAGVNELLDLLLLAAEMEELTGKASSPATGFVLESHLDPRSGNTATLIVKDGTLRLGDFLVIGRAVTKIKQLNDFRRQPAPALTFSAPAEIFGFSDLPPVGAPFRAFADKSEATAFAATAAGPEKSNSVLPPPAEGAIVIPLIVKTDVAGTLEAVLKELAKLTVEQTALELIGAGVGAITENDVQTLSAFPRAKIIGFRVKTDKGALALAEKTGVVIKTSDVIYQLSEWLEAELQAVAPQQITEEILGRAKILKTFGRTKDKQIVGATVVSGVITAGRSCKIIRRETEIGRGRIIGLQVQKIKVSEVGGNDQFGAEIEARAEIAIGDYLEIFTANVK